MSDAKTIKGPNGGLEYIVEKTDDSRFGVKIRHLDANGNSTENFSGPLGPFDTPQDADRAAHFYAAGAEIISENEVSLTASLKTM